jgi:CubicO group peptidase (beta-lactamase class C family)
MAQAAAPLSAQARQAVDELVGRTQAQTRAPSLIAAVVRDGAVAHVSGAGGTPVPDRDRQYRIGSITKSLTAALVLGLRDQGRLDLDDPVDAHLPGLPLPGVRLRHLLGHASGLQREPEGLWWERNPGGGFQELLAGVSAAKLAFGRYQRYHYSNLAYGLLGGIVARLTAPNPRAEHAGEATWWDAVATGLLAPLGMTRTTYHPSEPYARGYVVDPRDGTRREEPREDAGAMAPAGQLWSTVDDLARWAAALAGHHPQVLSPERVDEMAHPVVLADPQAWTDGYGLGLQLWRSGERVYIGHTGSMPGYLAVVAVHRRSGTGVVVFANCYSLPGSGIGRTGVAILNTVLDLEPLPEPARRASVVPAPAEVEPLLGTWWWMGREHTARWTEPGELVIESPTEDWRFTPEGPDRWRGGSGEQAGEILAVLRDPDGAVSGLDIATFVFRRTPMAD